MISSSVIQLLCLFALITVIWTLCLPTELEIGTNNCKSTCPSDKAIYEQTCISTCPTYTRRLETDLARYCVVDNEFSCLGRLCSGDFPFCYHSNCVKACPEYTVTYNDTCILTCPEEAPFVTTEQCKGICLTGKKVCSPKCPESQSFVFHSKSFKYCLQKCPDFTAISFDQLTCSTKCPHSAPYLFNNTCHNICPDTHMMVFTKISKFNIIPMCTQSCPIQTVIDGNVCVKFCPSGKHLFNKTCVKECPKSHPILYPRNKNFINRDYGDSGRALFMCVKSCHIDESYYLMKTPFRGRYDDGPASRLYKNTCMVQCPSRAKFDFNGTCAESCPSNNSFSLPVLGTTMKCVSKCPSIHYQKTCRDHCPYEAPYQLHNTCHKACPNEYPFQQKNRYDYSCVKSCKHLYFGIRCFSSCPNEAKYQHNNTCVSQCDGARPFTNSYVIEDKTYWPYKKIYKNRCLASCPNLKTSNKECVDICPKDAKYVINSTCEPSCNDNLPYAVDELHNKHVNFFCKQSCHQYALVYNGTVCVAICPEDAIGIFNSSCVHECPLTSPMKYFKKHEIHVGQGKYHCVESCPNKTYFYNETCFDQCPEHLKTYMYTCTELCPISHPFIYIQQISYGRIEKCLNKCPKGTVINEYVCDNQCPTKTPYIEKNLCVKFCQNPYAVIEISKQGKECHAKCRNHLLLLNDSCVVKCPNDRLIVDSSCKQIDKCPYHTFIEYSEIGKRCTNICSAKFYLDGLDCIKDCPPHKVIAGMNCLDECPSSFPLSHKDFSSKPRIHCYKTCPSDYVANGTECIESSKCQVEKYYTYNFRCYQKCPFLTIDNGDQSCLSMSILITLLIICILCLIISLIFIYIAACFTGRYSKRKKCTDTFDQEREVCEKTDESNTTPLISFDNGDVENKHSEHLNSIEVRSGKEDIMAELDDGYKIFIDQNSRVKYEPVYDQKEKHDKRAEDETHTNSRNETKEVQAEVLSSKK